MTDHASGSGTGALEARLAALENGYSYVAERTDVLFALLQKGHGPIHELRQLLDYTEARLVDLQLRVAPCEPAVTELKHRIDSIARIVLHLGSPIPPGQVPETTSTILPPPANSGTTRSVLFVHNSYYHFLYLAAALRRRGWDALSLSMEDPEGANSHFYHGEDVTIWSPDQVAHARAVDALGIEIPARFKWVQFSGKGQMALSRAQFDHQGSFEQVPWDVIALKQRGVKVGYTISGCHDGLSQSAYNEWAGGTCSRCSLRDKPTLCSDVGNQGWGHKRNLFFDLVAGEMLPKLDMGKSPKVYSEPLTMSLDETVWHPELAIPPAFLHPRDTGKVLVFHAVGNYSSNAETGVRDYKGTRAIVAAVELLKAEGLPIEFLFTERVHSREMRFIQAQADIIVDQLNAGRYGAFAREALMLGKPVIGYKVVNEPDGRPLASMMETPVIHATEASIADVLRELVSDRARREDIGRRSRAFAVKWHGATAQAERFEQIYDHVMAGGSPAEFVWQPSPEVLAAAAGVGTA
jgi:hypothetical protein